MVTKCKLECDVGGKGLVWIPGVIDFEALSDLYPHTIIDCHACGRMDAVKA